MILLANGNVGQTGPVVACEPEVYRFDHRGVRFAFDPNSMKLGVLQDSDTDDVLADFALALRPNYPFGQPQAPGAICLDMTRACPARCTYCFAQNDDKRDKNQHLSFGDAINGLSIVLPRVLREGGMRNHQVEFSFFGGEPLVRWDVIKKIVHHVKCWLPCKHHFHTTTNAMLMTPEIARFLEDHGFSTIVSVDGTQKAHDECRVRVDGSGTYAAVMRGLEVMHKYCPTVLSRTTLRSTFTPQSVRTEGIAERIAHLNDLVAQGFGSYVSVEPSFLGESTCTNHDTVDSENTDYTKFRDRWQAEYDRAADSWLERIAQDKPAYFHHFISFTRRLVNSRPSASECGAAKGYFTIAPGGELYACHHEGGTRLGNVHTGGVDQELAAPWQDNRYYARLKCPTCPIRNMCGGGCREYSVASGLGVSMPVQNECELKWILFRTNAWLMYKTLTDDGLRDKALKYWSPSKSSCSTQRP